MPPSSRLVLVACGDSDHSKGDWEDSMDLDRWAVYLINSVVGKWPLLDWLMIEISRPGNLPIPVVMGLIYWVWARKWEAVICAPILGISVGVGDVLGAQCKELFARPRPCQVLPDLQELVGCGGSMSLPSNHALNTATAAMFLSVLYPRLGWILWPVAGGVGVSRVYLAAHYPSDVLVGWCMGGALGGMVALGLKRWVLSPARGRSDSQSGSPSSS